MGATAAIGRRFSASGFWDEARAFEATVFNFLGATLTILWKQHPSDRDRDHRVRLAWGVPMPGWKSGWEQRFGFPLYELYGLTDAGVPAYDPLDQPKRPGSCGRVIDQFDLTIVDEHDVTVPIGTVGEITVRGHEPGLVMNEYWAMSEATAHAFRGGRFHTGDLGHLDADGYLYFHGRAHDAIRRRGENISAYEVEQVLTLHPDILEAAAIGVASELTEQDVKACVVPRPGASLTPAQIRDHCLAHAPTFMVPATSRSCRRCRKRRRRKSRSSGSKPNPSPRQHGTANALPWRPNFTGTSCDRYPRTALAQQTLRCR